MQHPIMLAGMGGIAGKELVGAVARAGGFATFGAAVSISRDGPAELRKQLREITQLCGGRPYGVDLLVSELNSKQISASIIVACGRCTGQRAV